MNRRNFFGSLAVLPFIGSIVKAADLSPKKTVVNTECFYDGRMGRDSWAILSPYEIIEAGFVLVTTPASIVDDQAYCIKTKKLDLWLPPERVEAFTSRRGLDKDEDLRWITTGVTQFTFGKDFKEEAIRQIKQIGFTHVYSVKFNESPMYNVQTCESMGHMAFVRGAALHWYRGSVYEAASRRV